MNYFRIYFSLLAIAFTFFLASCEDVINVDLPEGESELVVDAMLTDDPGEQLVKLRMTHGYLNNNRLRGATGATVKVTDLFGRTFDFIEDPGTGNYKWKPLPGDTIPFGIAGNVYTLDVKYNGNEFYSVAFMDSVLRIDSLGVEFREEARIGGEVIKAGYVLTMKARDIPGEGNCYWFRTYRNGVRYNRPNEINLAYDGAFGPGSDNVDIIPPIVASLSPERFDAGDTIVVECLSIGIPTFTYLLLARSQMTNGGLFAVPPSNVPSNIKNRDENSKTKALGWFGAASVERKGIRIIPE
jgi:hypothetical protein